jgi:hypothetical protein
MGFIFGLVFEKSRVFEPKVIQAQFRFEKWLMLKMFAAAMASSAVSLIIIYLSSIKMFNHVRDTFHGCKRRGIFTAVIPGGLLLGAGKSCHLHTLCEGAFKGTPLFHTLLPATYPCTVSSCARDLLFL